MGDCYHGNANQNTDYAYSMYEVPSLGGVYFNSESLSSEITLSKFVICREFLSCMTPLMNKKTCTLVKISFSHLLYLTVSAIPWGGAFTNSRHALVQEGPNINVCLLCSEK